MRHFIKASRILLRLQKPSQEKLSSKTISIPVLNSNIHCDIYGQNKQPRRNHEASIILLHGLSTLGNKDERIIALAQAFALCGYRVVVPEFHEIKQLKISHTQLDLVTSFITGITSQRPDLFPQGKTALIAPSFTAALAVGAAVQLSKFKTITSMWLIGGMTDLAAVVDYLFCHPDADTYGRYIVIKNFIFDSIPFTEELSLAIDTAIEDNRTGADRLKQIRSNMSASSLRILERIENDVAFRRQLAREFIAHNTKTFESLNLTPHHGKIVTPAFILHGTDDRVVPHQHSQMLNDLMHPSAHARLLITSILTHADAKFSIRSLKETIQLIAGLRYFLKMAA